MSNFREKVYDHCEMYHPNGNLMCYIKAKRAMFYIKNNLAEIIEKSPLKIKLTFEPNGEGDAHHPFFASLRENKCVCCGSVENLTVHHCVPKEYRKYFPDVFKKDAHDCVAMCYACHVDYEVEARKLKDRLENKFKTHNPVSFSMNDCGKYLKTLYKYWDKIPEPRRQAMIEKTEELLGMSIEKDKVESIYRKLENQNKLDRENKKGRLIVEKFDEHQIHKFCRIWRKHFVKFAKPKFLNEHWSVDYHHVEKERTN